METKRRRNAYKNVRKIYDHNELRWAIGEIKTKENHSYERRQNKEKAIYFRIHTHRGAAYVCINK